ncbi:MAG: hypothetical protein IRY99_08630, partial [Isosphaeraceae bacterium]|nr:hypothetical protein [Isosphaeraceae bacterium]
MARTRTTAPEKEKARPRPASSTNELPPPSPAARLADAGLIAALLALTFLLGAFPLKDTDFWWHLRTGDLIRQTGQIPVTDPYLFGGKDLPWIDLHWGFQVLLSWGYQHGGIVGLNLAKCTITSLAVLLLISARRRDWPVWAMLLAWLPALYVLGGRMYVRPETLTLLFLSIYLAVLSRWDRSPRLAFILPAVQVLWVNTQGLFVFGPALLALALLDAALAPGAFAPSRQRWWRTVLLASGLACLACLVNPYGALGAIYYPIQLAQTMGNPIFQSIGELKPIPTFIREAGLHNFQIQMHLLVMALGALSFLVPLVWRLAIRIADARSSDAGPPPSKSRRAKKAQRDCADDLNWRLRPFRLLLFAAFSLLSLKATRNSHQFAAVVGTVTAWNIGEWIAAVRRRRFLRTGLKPGPDLVPRLMALGSITLAFVGVASGTVYALAGEGRTVGLGEEPLWYPHEAVRFAGRPGMPDRFLCFHNGHAALYEYYHGPARKTFADARLEVVGAGLYERYMDLQASIASDSPGWPAMLDELGRPGVLVDLVHGSGANLPAVLLTAPHWRCVYFDPIAALFVHDSYRQAPPAVDFAARHFRPDPTTALKTIAELMASAKALKNVATELLRLRRADLAAPLITLGEGYAHRVLRLDPDSAEAWKLIGQLEVLRDPP